MPIINRKIPLLTFIFLAALTGSLPATTLAEEANPVVELGEIVVTGSHIQRKNLVSASPVTSVHADELLYQGTVRVEDMVRTLPQVYSTQNTSQSNGATGTATLNLRNQMRVTWTTPWNLAATVMWRHIGEVDDRNEDGVDLKDIDYFDLSAILEVKDGIQLRTGINNLFDKEPPIAGNGAGPATQGNGNTFPGLYDALGRYWFLAAGLSF